MEQPNSPLIQRRNPPVDTVKALIARLNEKALVSARNFEAKERRECFFQTFIVEEMLSRFKNDLDEMEIEQEIIQKILDEAGSMTYEDMYRALSYPHELRTPFLSKILGKVRAGEIQPEKVLSEMASVARKYGFSVGFHMSQYDIKPSNKGWTINGKEADHRDNDLAMAYYARKFDSLYKQKLSAYLYIIRAEDTHRVGEDGRWYRAPSLSIVQKIPLDFMEQEIAHLNQEFADAYAQKIH